MARRLRSFSHPPGDLIEEREPVEQGPGIQEALGQEFLPPLPPLSPRSSQVGSLDKLRLDEPEHQTQGTENVGPPLGEANEAGLARPTTLIVEASEDEETRLVRFSPGCPETRMITPDETSAPSSEDASTEHIEAASKYGKLEREGAQRRRWMDDPNEPDCQLLVSTLTFDRLCEMCGIGPDDVKREDIPPLYKQHVRGLGVPIGPVYQQYTTASDDFTWQGYTGPGMILIDDIRRAKTDAPRISQITQAVYERDYSISSLRHVFVLSVISDVTETFLRRRLYEANGLQWLREDDVPQTWAFGTPEYDALLGTPRKVGCETCVGCI